MNDPDVARILDSLSVPAELHDPGLSRRRFLQGVVAAGVVATALPSWMARDAHAATAPTGGADGVLVVVALAGGNDGTNVLVPIDHPSRRRYDALRGGLAIPAGALLPVDGGMGLHPSLSRLQARYQRGQVGLIQGTGTPGAPLSHTEAMATMMSGTADGSTGSGWLGRYLDGLADSHDGLRGLAVSSSVPLLLRGAHAQITTVPAGPTPPADSAHARAIRDVIRAYGTSPTGLGPLGDELAAAGLASFDQIEDLQQVYAAALPAPGPTRDLTLAARLVNAGLGARVIGVTIGGWDTHLGQLAVQAERLKTLDDAIEAFFEALAPAVAGRVSLLTVSEFGRRAQGNASGGTDHGAASVTLLAGQNVRGGLQGAPSSFDKLDARGNLVPTVDSRAVYASVLDRWLGGDAGQVLGARYGQLDLFAAGPGAART